MDPDAGSRGWLFFAAVPDAETAQRIYWLSRALKRAHKFGGKVIEPDRLHVTLFFLGELSEQLVRVACDAAAEIQARPFEIRFDRSVSFRGRSGNCPFVLVGDNGLDRLKSFRRTLGLAMARKGLRHLAKRDFTPHITLLYAERNVEDYPIELIGWTVSEFVLIHGKRRHVHLARWPLHPCRS